MTPSPIELAVDRATGRVAVTQGKPAALEKGPAALLECADTVMAWWKTKRPCRWRGTKKHLANPCVNTNGDAEKRLALIAAKLTELGF